MIRQIEDQHSIVRRKCKKTKLNPIKKERKHGLMGQGEKFTVIPKHNVKYCYGNQFDIIGRQTNVSLVVEILISVNILIKKRNNW